MDALQIETDPPEASLGGDKRSREGKIRSKVWAHFIKILKDNGKCDKCQCNQCHKLFTCSCRSGTAHLLRHISDGIYPVFQKDPAVAVLPSISSSLPLNTGLLLPWKLDRPGSLPLEPLKPQTKGDSACAAEFRDYVARLVSSWPTGRSRRVCRPTTRYRLCLVV